MRNLMEKQLSWLALLVTAFYSLLATVKGNDCGPDTLTRCARPLERINSNDFTIIASSKEELEQLCPDLQSGITCIRSYTVRCLKDSQRTHFNQLYLSTNVAIMELCQEGNYQDEFLRHAPCVQKVQPEYEKCFKKYQNATKEIERASRNTGSTAPLQSICCAFQEYLGCSHRTVKDQCGEKTAQFMKEFLDRMSSSLLSMHCKPYTSEVCAAASGSTSLRLEFLVPVILVGLGRYFT